LYCPYPQIQQIFNQAIHEVKAIEKSQKNTDCSQFIHDISQALQSNRQQHTPNSSNPRPSPSRSKPMLGLWAPAEIQVCTQRLHTSTQLFPEIIITQLHKLLIRIGKITTKAAMKAWYFRRRYNLPTAHYYKQHKHTIQNNARHQPHQSLNTNIPSPPSSPVSTVSTIHTQDSDTDIEDPISINDTQTHDPMAFTLPPAGIG
jgi:hypothetical protein